ncbi:hypothetical protein C7271_12085 [filamentous cyanobacterium CCP5]|nr:hypothetical protein C7271_12085 [filamentous cyanobacterium CCP5]
METLQVMQVVTFPGWVVGVTRHPAGYRCWVITPEQVVLNDGEMYQDEDNAIAAGRILVKLSLESANDQGERRQTDF